MKSGSAVADGVEQRRDARPHARGRSVQSRIKFLREFIEHPSMVGALAPSSPHLARKMVEGVDFDNATAIVEFGPGTGVFTEQILRRLRPGCRFFAVERNDEMARHLRKRFPEVTVYEDNAANVAALCERSGIPVDHIGEGDRRAGVDYVISGLPWATFPAQLQNEILGETVRVLKPGGEFRTFAYHCGLVLPSAKRLRRTLNRLFSRVETSRVVWLNMPPAVIYHCTR